jgi:N-methylhydantoinase A
LKIDLAAAERAVSTDVAERFGLSVRDAAARIVEVVNSNMAQALRIVSVERGHDPREFSLIAFGGAGPVHAVALAEELAIPEVIIPPAPGAFSALGLVATDLKRDYARTLYADLARVEPARVGDAFTAMETAGAAMLEAASVPPERRALVRSADVRYRRQAYELTLPLENGAVTRSMLDRLAAAFHDKHAQTYGHANPAEPVQLVNLRLTAVGKLADLKLAQPSDPASARVRQREVWFAATGFVSADVHWRNGLAAGTAVAGPAIIEALDSTTVVPPGWIARVDALGYIRLTRA